MDIGCHIKVCKLPFTSLEKQGTKSSIKGNFRINENSMERIHPEKLISPQTVKKFPTFYETRRFVTASRRIPSSERPTQSMSTPSHFFQIPLQIILPSMPKPSNLSLSLRFLHKNLHAPLLFPIHATCPCQKFQNT